MRLQSAIEFLLTYAWAFLSITAFLAFLLAFISTGGPANLSTASCYISPDFSCITAIFVSNQVASQFTVVLINNLGQQITFPINALTVYPSYSGSNIIGNCLPANAPNGAMIICNSTVGKKIGQQGQQLNPKFTLNYEICTPNCIYPIVSRNTINTTGFATLQISPYAINPLANVTLRTGPTSGNIVLNGIPYPNNNIQLFIYNFAYTVYAAPPPGYKFSTWGVSGGVTVNLISENPTTSKATTKGTLTATFVPLP